MISGLVGTIHKSGGVKVRGEDQLHSYLGTLQSMAEGLISAANGYLNSAVVPDGEIWVVTQIAARDTTSATTQHTYLSSVAAALNTFWHETAAFAAAAFSYRQLWLWLEHDDFVRVVFAGGLAGDTCRIVLFGHRMTLET